MAGPTAAARYGYWFFVFSWVGYSALERVASANDAPAEEPGWRGPVLAAGLNFGAYWLVLRAYQLDRHASYIVAVRQFSIVLGWG